MVNSLEESLELLRTQTQILSEIGELDLSFKTSENGYFDCEFTSFEVDLEF